MAFDNRDNIDFGRDKIPHLFKALFIPTLMGMVFDVTFILADGIFVGHGIGADGLAGVNIASPLMMILTGLGVMFGMGSSVVAAIHLSKGNVKAARINVTQAFAAATLLAIIIAIIFYTFPDQLLRLFGASDHLLPMTHTYLMWFVPTCLFILIQIIGSFMIRLDGSPIFSMVANIIPAIVNLTLDYIFIFPLGMGMKGAALATSIGTCIGASIPIYYVLFKAKTLRFHKLKRSITSLRLSIRNIGYMMKVGFPGFLGECAISVMALTGNLAFGKYTGDAGIAAFSVICYITPLLINFNYAITASIQPIISFNYGAGEWSRVNRTFRYGVGVGTAFSAILTVASICFAAPVISIFIPDVNESFELASSGLPLFAASFIFTTFNVVVTGYFQSIEKSIIACILVSLRGILFITTCFILLPMWLGNNGLWLAIPASELMTAIFAAALLYGSRRKFTTGISNRDSDEEPSPLELTED